MTQLLIDRATLEQLVAALENHAGNYKLNKAESDVHRAAITAGLAALANAEPAGCLWSKDPDFEMGDTYDSACGEKWSFIDGGPTENRVSFCQGCGKPVYLAKDTL